VPAVEAAIELNIDRIEFISEYCDRWCERCPFTVRCSAYAVRVATAMCDGDFSAALELAVGAPPPQSVDEATRRDAFREALDYEPSHAELEEARREEEARQERVDESPLTTGAMRVSTLARAWFESNSHDRVPTADRRLEGAIEVASWDACLIGAKLHRALHGRDAFGDETDFEMDPVQNDWNGSAKVALISIARSIRAWETIATATDDDDAAKVAEELRLLETEVQRTFPDAWKFIRPGFDQLP
jgi:hypothetical protein